MSSLVEASKEQPDIKNLVINMKVISKLQPHVRLDTSSSLFKIYQPTAYMPVWIQRWWAVHNRKTDIARVSLLYDSVLKLADRGVEEDTKNTLIKALRESITGLNNLKTTYEDDITCVSSLEYIIERIGPYITGEQ
jgi:hypothetical protein